MITYFDLLSFVVNDIFYDGTDAILIHIVFTLGRLCSSRYNGEGNLVDRHMYAYHPHRHHPPRKFSVHYKTGCKSRILHGPKLEYIPAGHFVCPELYTDKV